MAKKREPKPPKSHMGLPLREPLVPVTAEEIHVAVVSAATNALGRTPRQSFDSRYDDAVQSRRIDTQEPHVVPTEKPINHMAAGVVQAFPEPGPAGDAKRVSLLWRVMFVLPELLADPRAAPYREAGDDNYFVGRPLLEALGTMPMKAAERIPLDEIFGRAAELAAQRS